MTLTLTSNPDVLMYIGQHRLPHQVVCGFAMETQNLIENATAKLLKKNCDLLVANHLLSDGAGFQTDTNIATIITPQYQKEYELMSKKELAKIILETMIDIEKEKTLC